MTKSLSQLFSDELDDDLQAAYSHYANHGKDDLIFKIQLLRRLDSLLYGIEELEKKGN